MICAICGEEVRVHINYARYASDTLGINEDGTINIYDVQELSTWDSDAGIEVYALDDGYEPVCGCEECPYMLFDEKVVERQGRYEISKIRRLGYSDAPNSKCSKCDNRAVYCHQWKTHEMSAPGFYYYCDSCLPEGFKAGIGKYTEEWEDV